MATVSSHHVLTSLSGAHRQGWSKRALLREAGIDPNILDGTETRVYDEQMRLLIQLIWKRLDDEFMGFTETPSKPGTFAFAVNTIRRCENLREALQTGFRFYKLVTDDIHTELITSGSKATIDIKFSRLELDGENYFQEFWMVIWHRLASWLTGIRIPLLEASFVIADLEHKKELSYMYPCTHSFGAASNQLVFDSDYLSLPLIRSKNEVRRFLARSPSNLMSIPGSDRSEQGRIISLLTPPSGKALEFPSIEDLAERLGVSASTLNRSLSKEMTNYRSVKNTMRRDTALKMLAQERLPIYAVAEAVGFSQSSAFIRAFKGWTGMSPRQYCMSLGVSQGSDTPHISE